MSSARHRDARYALGNLLASTGFLAEGRQQLKSAAVLAPDDTTISAALARLDRP